MQHQNVAGRSLMRAEIEQQPGALRDTIEALLPRQDGAVHRPRDV